MLINVSISDKSLRFELSEAFSFVGDCNNLSIDVIHEGIVRERLFISASGSYRGISLIAPTLFGSLGSFGLFMYFEIISLVVVYGI